MNVEISKILQMLEAGKINAEEAERLIRAMNDAAKPIGGAPEPETQAFPNPFRDLQELFRVFSDAQNRAARRQHRWLYWRHYKHARSEREAREKRAETMDNISRIRFILTDRILVEKQDFDSSANLSDLLSVSRWCCERTNTIAWENLQFGLEDEFGLDIPMDDLRGCQTVQALEEYIGTRSPSTVAQPSSTDSTADENTPASRKPKSPKTGATAPEPAV
jgi:hypothetical protein